MTLEVDPAATNTFITAPSVTYNAHGLVRVAVGSPNPGAGTPIGSVTLSVDGGPAVTGTLSGGSYLFDAGMLDAGSHSLSASYAAQGNYAASMQTATLHVNAAATSVSIAAPQVTYNANGIVTVTGVGLSHSAPHLISAPLNPSAGRPRKSPTARSRFVPPESGAAA